MARIIRNGKLAKFDPSKHRRDARGRFADKPDPPLTGRRSSKTRGTAKSDIRRDAQSLQARLEIYKALTPEQRVRLLEVLNRRKGSQGKPETEPAPAPAPVSEAKPKRTRKPKTTPETTPTSEPTKKKGSDRLSANPDHLTIKGDKLVIWEGKPELGKAQGGFKTRTVKNFEYAVEVNGGRVVLNRQTKMHIYMGERIYGMPSLNPRLASMTPTQLADGLAKYMTKVETKDATVPDWLPTFHGKVDKSLLKNGYGKMQQHHIHQWARIPLENIVKGYESGKITLDEAKAQTKAILSRESKKTKSGKLVEDWVLTPADKSQRSFVVLPGGLHDISNKPMYYANHPKGVDVDAPDFKLRSYRLPKHGDSGRDWHSYVFRPGSWLKIYRRESYVLLGEINRRINRGELTPQEAQSLFRQGLAKVDKANQYRLKYSNSQEG